MTRVVIGMDPHKRSVTIEVMSPDESVLGGGRYGTDEAGYSALLRDAKQWPERIWAIEGCSGIGRHVATRLVADGEQVVDVPPKLSAQARVFSAQRSWSRSSAEALPERCGQVSCRCPDGAGRQPTRAASPSGP